MQKILEPNKVLKLDTQRIRLLKLRINAETVKYSIAESREVSKIKLNQIQIKNEQVKTVSNLFNDTGLKKYGGSHLYL